MPFRFALLVVVAALAAPASAQAPLFSSTDAARLDLSARQAELLTSLHGERGVESVEVVRADASLLSSGGPLRLALPGAEVVLDRLSATPRENGTLSWSGRASRPGLDAWAVLVSRKGQITGSVWVGGYEYPLRPLTGGLHAVARKSLAEYQAHPDGYGTFVESNRERIAAERAAEARQAPAPRSGARRVTATVDVLVPYTPNVSAAIADPVALVQSFVDYANLTYDNSGLADLELRLVHAYETADASSGNLETDLYAVQGTADGTYDEVHVYRDAYGADLVALISGTNTSGTCGIGFVNASAASAFSANSASCGAVTFAHEVGHNFGSEHDAKTRADNGDTSLTYSYGQGYINQTGRWGTVMGYNAACLPAGLCEIVPYLSNPDVSYTDATSPVSSGPTGDAATADNARVHEERAATLASYYAESLPPALAYGPASLSTAIPSGTTDTETLTIQNAADGGSKALDWTATLVNAAGPSGSRTGPGEKGLRVHAEPLDLAAPRAAPATGPSARAAGSAGDCTDGQTIAQTVATAALSLASGGTEVGQTFTATCTGRLEAVAFVSNYGAAPNVTWDLTVRVYEGAGTGGTPLLNASTSVANGGSGAYILTITLPTPVDLTSGETYSFFLDMTSNTAGTYIHTGNAYTGGTMLQTSNGDPASATAVAGSDLYFRLDLLAPTTPSISWVSLSATAGTVAAGASSDVAVSFDATGLADGTYTADLVLTTGDPEAITSTVPVTLTVADAVADLTVGDGVGWRVLSVPANAVTVADLASQNLVQGVTGSYPGATPNLYTAYDGASWTAAASTTEALAPGRGVAWYLFDEAIDPDPSDPNNSASVPLPAALSAVGTPVTGDVPVSVHGNGFDLLGNPYGALLDVSGIAGWSGAETLASFVGQVYRCTPNGASPVACVGSYETTTSLGDAVPAWHGVFFDTNTAGTLTIPSSAKGAVVSRTAERLVAFGLASAAGDAVDRAATLVFRGGATASWDGWDAAKLAPLDARTVVLAFEGTHDGEAVLKAQESRAASPGRVELAVVAASQGAGEALVLSWPRLDVPTDWSLTLTDRVTGEVVDLHAQDRYAFTVAESAARVGSRPGARVSRSDAARFTLAVEAGKAVAGGEPPRPALSLDGARPNPVRGQGSVAYSLAEAGPVRLSVLDLLGREVAVLAEGDRPAGPGVAPWRPDALAAGVYVLRLEAGGAVLARRAVVAR